MAAAVASDYRQRAVEVDADSPEQLDEGRLHIADEIAGVHRIHRVIKADVVPSLLDRWPEVPATDDTVRPQAVYDLGPRLPPYEPLPNGAQYRASRLWVLLDQLQSSATLAEAMARTRRLTGRD